jgi:hypothetical protein
MGVRRQGGTTFQAEKRKNQNTCQWEEHGHPGNYPRAIAHSTWQDLDLGLGDSKNFHYIPYLFIEVITSYVLFPRNKAICRWFGIKSRQRFTSQM